MLRLFPDIWTVPPFKRNYYQSLYCDFVLHSDLEMHVHSLKGFFSYCNFELYSSCYVSVQQQLSLHRPSHQSLSLCRSWYMEVFNREKMLVAGKYWDLFSFLKHNSDLHNYNTRHKTDLHPLTCRTNLTKNNGLNMGIILYNRLPQNIKKLDTKHIFKNSVKKFLLQHVFYSVDEYLFS